jgi:hypothetical protein
METNQPKNIKPKMRGNKLRSRVNWYGALKKKTKQTGAKQDLDIFSISCLSTSQTHINTSTYTNVSIHYTLYHHSSV